jgi:hypothetical protein
LQLRYKPPDPVGAGPLAGNFEITFEVPNNTGLSPGGQPIKSITLTASWGSFTQNVTPGTVATLNIAGPALLPAATATVTLSAVFVDIDGRQSPSSAPISRSIADPRPPVPVTISRTLNLTGRRDASGLAHVELSWPAQPGQAGYRIFYAGEAALRGALASSADQARASALIAALAAATTRADRAGLIIDQKDLFLRSSFELLTPQPVPVGRFLHSLSGSLSDVAFYRIVAVGSQGVECDFKSSGLAAVGVPDDRRPAPPVLAAVPDKAGVVIRVPPGPEPAAEYRIRRTRIGLADTRSLRVVASGMVPPAAAGTPQMVQWLDTVQPDFVRVTYVAEVRYARESGTDRDREWSLPSNPTTWVSIPATTPEAIPAAQVTVNRNGASADIQVAGIRPVDLDLLALPRVEVYRELAGGTFELLQEQAVTPTPANTPIVFTDPNPAGVSQYNLVLIDPIERASPATSVPLV